MCCTRLASYRMQKSPKIRHLRTITQLCRAISSQLRYVSTIGKKVVKQQYLPHMSPEYGKPWPTSGWHQLVSLGHPTKFQRVSHLGFVTAATSLNGSQPNFAQFWPLPGLVGYVYIFGGCCFVTEFSYVQNSLCILQVLRSPVGSINAWQSSSGRETNFVALNSGRHLYSAERPSCWALTHILVLSISYCF